MYNPTTRLLTILELLQAHGELSGVDLAARLEVDVRPADFDVLAFIEESIANTPGVWQVDLFLATTVAEAERMIPCAVGKPQPADGGVTLRAYVQDLNWFAYFLARVDCPVQVIHPPEARIALQELAKRINAMATA